MGTEMQVWTLDALERAAAYIVRSGLFGVKRPEEAIALMLLAQAEGLHPMRAVQEYHIINGRPALRADAMLARFLAAGGRVEWHELSDQRAEATFSHPQGGSVRIAWTLEDAKRAGLIQKPGSNWDKYPRAMLRARVVSEGVRTVYPGVVVGVYTPEEVSDFEPPEAAPGPQAREAEVVQLPAPAPAQAPTPSEGQAPTQGEYAPATEKQVAAIWSLLKALHADDEDIVRWMVLALSEEAPMPEELSRGAASRVIGSLQALRSEARRLGVDAEHLEALWAYQAANDLTPEVSERALDEALSVEGEGGE